MLPIQNLGFNFFTPSIIAPSRNLRKILYSIRSVIQSETSSPSRFSDFLHFYNPVVRIVQMQIEVSGYRVFTVILTISAILPLGLIIIFFSVVSGNARSSHYYQILGFIHHLYSSSFTCSYDRRQNLCFKPTQTKTNFLHQFKNHQCFWVNQLRML